MNWKTMMTYQSLDLLNLKGIIWIDHDFMESGFEEPKKDMKIQFEKYSYANSWGKELEKRCLNLTESGWNTLVFINENQIEKPNSVRGNGYILEYLGILEYEI